MARYKFAPILTPDNINRIHRELTQESREIIDEMADCLGERICKMCQDRFPEEKIKYLRREKAREIIYALVLHGYL